MISISKSTAGRVGRAFAGCLGLLALPPVLASQVPPKPAAPKTTVSGEAAGTVATPASLAPITKPSGIPTSITIERETFDYARSGRRDPYQSLMRSDELRPLLSDLKLTAVAFDATGAHSVAILRDTSSKQQYMLKVGQQLGRLRVTSIKHKSVVFTIDEFGFNRQETLQMGSDTTKSRTP